MAAQAERIRLAFAVLLGLVAVPTETLQNASILSIQREDYFEPHQKFNDNRRRDSCRRRSVHTYSVAWSFADEPRACQFVRCIRHRRKGF